MLQRALDVKENNLGKDHVSVATTLHSLAALSYQQKDLPVPHAIF